MSKVLSDLTEATTFATTDIFAMVVDGNSRKVAISSLFALAAKSTFAAGTLTADTPHIFSATFNNAGVTFNGKSNDFTDSASASGSLLERWRVGGADKASIDKAGNLVLAGYLLLTSNPGWAWTSGGLNARVKGAGGVGLQLGSTTALGWTSDTSANGTVDLALYRGAAGILAQRNGTNAQAFNIYNTYTDASNYERGFFAWTSSILKIGTEAAGTGTVRNVDITAIGGVIEISVGNTSAFRFMDTGGGGRALRLRNTGRLEWTDSTSASSGNVDLTILRDSASVARILGASSGGAALQMAEMTAPSAPSANGVRIYAEDDGAGKTRLMALFATGAAQQIAIEP